MATLTTGNGSLGGAYTDPIGTDMWNIITAASNGTLIQSVIIKAQVSTTQGMIRLFLSPGTNDNFLLKEIIVPAITKSGTDHSFSHRVDFDGKDFALKSGWILRASTQNSETFNVIAEGLNWGYPR